MRDYLAREPVGQALLEWDGAPDTLLPLLSESLLQHLNHAFLPRRRVTRSLHELTTRLAACRTTAQLRQGFESWLDGGEGLSPDDEVSLSG